MKKVIFYLVFAISALAGQAQDPAIVMTTAKSINSQFTFGIQAAAPNTPIQIDWGNGVKENFTIGNSLEFFNYPLKGNSVKIWGEGITNLYVASMELTALDVTRATSLTYLHIKTNKISTLDLSNCTALTYVDCSINLLNSLNLPNTSTLVGVNCANNKLTFVSLPTKQPTWTSYTYSPQQNFALPKQTYSTNEEIDLSGQLNVDSQTTTYTWKTESGTTLVNGTDYNENGGKFTFLKTFPDSLYCEMTNAAFPDLILTTTKISIPQLPNVLMTTTSAVGSTFTFKIGATANNTPIKVDWGNGTLASYTIAEYTTVSGTLAGSTIKIYGVGINYLSLSSNNLNALDVSNTTTLKNLKCQYNSLATLDVSKNIELEILYCDVNKITSLDVSKNIALKELKFSFNQVKALNVTNNTALTLLNCGSNQLTALDVTKNTELSILNCSSNSLTAIDVTKNTKLTQLSCSSNPLISLDVTNNPALINLWCSSNQLNTIDVSNNSALKTLDCSSNQLTDLDLTNNTALLVLTIYNNKFSFSTLPVMQASWDTYTYSPQANLVLPKTLYDLNEEIDLSSQFTAGGNTTVYTWKTVGGKILVKDSDYTENNGKFTFLKQPGDYFYCEMRNGTFPELTLSTENISITPTEPSVTMTTTSNVGSTFTFEIGATANNTPINVDWGNGTLASYTIGEYTTVSGTLAGSTIKIYGFGIKHLDLWAKNLTSLDVTNNTALTNLYCSWNQITTLDITKNTKLKILYCHSNRLTTLDVSKNTSLTLLFCDQNLLTTLDVSKNTELTYLDFSGNRLTTLDVSKNAKLTFLDCSDNRLTTLDVTNNNTLTKLYCSKNQLTALDVSKSNSLKELYCNNNSITSLDVSNLDALRILHCFSNGMNNLTIDGCNSLETLYCYYNNLTSLNTSSCPSLKLLYCTGNKIASLDVSENLNLTELGCTDNMLTSLDLSKNTKLELLGCSNNQLTNIDLQNNPLLYRVHLANNQLTQLNLANNPLISRLDIPGNWLTFATLPIATTILTNYIYSPQRNIVLPKKQYGLTETVDLSSESTINGNATNYVWKTKGGSTLIAGTDYEVTNGVTTFLKVQPDSVYCEMTNASFPALTLKTSSIKVSQFPLSVPNSKLSASVFPNPASELVNIELNENIFRVEIFNSLGIKLLEQETNITPRVVLPLNNIPAGILIVRAYTKNGFTENKIVKL